MIPLNELFGELLTPCSDVLDHVPTREAVEHELPCEWFASSSVATDELANHGHGASASNTNIHGTFDVKWTNSEFPTSGVFSIASNGARQNAQGIGTNCGATVTFNSTHSHGIYVANTGGNAKHENRMPYIVINRWKRTA